MIEILIVDISGGIVGMIGLVVFFVGLLIYAIMAGKTNYANAGIAMGFTVLGFIAMLISALCAIYQMFKGDTKKKKLFGFVELMMIILLAIFGYSFPYYSQKLTTQYSNLMSIFVTPLWIYVAILACHIIFELKEKGILVSILLVISIIVVFIMLGTGFIGINYFFDNKKVLNWADTHYHYCNKEIISYRMKKYGADEFTIIAAQNLESIKNQLLEKGNTLEEIRDKFLDNSKYYNSGYFEYELKKYREESPNVYVCDFVDTAQYTDNNNIPHYYCKIDFSNFTIIEYLNYYYKISDEALKYIESGINSFYGAISYSVERCKAENEAITKENLNNHLKEMVSVYSCYSAELKEGTKYKVVIKRNTDGEWRVSNNAETFIVDSSTYDITFDF